MADAADRTLPASPRRREAARRAGMMPAAALPAWAAGAATTLRLLPAWGRATLPAAAVAKADDGDKMICKYRAQTGTRFKTKVCKTAAQWEEMAEQHRVGAKELVDRPQILVCGPQTGC